MEREGQSRIRSPTHVWFLGRWIAGADEHHGLDHRQLDETDQLRLASLPRSRDGDLASGKLTEKLGAQASNELSLGTVPSCWPEPATMQTLIFAAAE